MTVDAQPAALGGAGGRRVLGLLLLVPAAACCALQFLIPSIQTILTSLQDATLLREASFVGFENYARLLDDRRFIGAVGFTLLVLVVRLAAVAVVPLLLAVGVSRLGRAARGAARVLFTVPVALFMPVALALAWRLAYVAPGAGPPPLADPQRAPGALLYIDGLYTLGLACGAGLIFYLAALRRPADGTPGKMRLPLLAAWLVGALAAVASALQTFTFSYTLTNGGPAASTTTLMLYYYQTALERFQFGPAAVVGVLVLLLLAPLGILLTGLAVFGGLQLRHAPPEAAPPGRGGLALALLAVGVLLGGGACALGALPLARTLPAAFAGFGRFFAAVPFAGTALNTILPPLVSVLALQVPLAYAGALGIGALRPLGRRSEWLLLLFSPWLFVTVRPLTIAFFEAFSSLGALDTFAARMPPLLLNLPMLFILTLFFKGQAAQRSAGRNFVQTFILPSLPLLGLLACAALFIAMQDAWWPLLVSRDPASATASLQLERLAVVTLDVDALAAGLLAFGLPSFLFFWLVFSAFQALYLERLSLSVAGGEPAAPPAEEAPAPPAEGNA